MDGIEVLAESWRKESNPQVSTIFTMSLESKWADAERNGRTCLKKPITPGEREI